MPFVSKAQMAYLKANEPEVYQKFLAESVGVDLSKLPERVPSDQPVRNPNSPVSRLNR